ncbi:hypothetical protein [Williamsia sp.]|uniref:Rv0361 family membrane protein n=1 Tax=Williamsia sp. TaxID=1872085 RepID=UPI001A341F36|nr:hypothetical protein [Williamsia sp.]MBJ7290205.1 hypothetical protein [Williamsia sp.]
MSQPPYGPSGDQPGGPDPRQWGPPPQPGYGPGPYGSPGPAGPYGPPPGTYGPPPGTYGGPPNEQPPYGQQAFGPPSYGPPGYGPPGQGWPPAGPGPKKNRGPWIAAVIVIVVVLIAGGITAAALLAGGDSDDSSASGGPSGSSTVSTGASPRDSTSPDESLSSGDAESEIRSAVTGYASALLTGDAEKIPSLVCAQDVANMTRATSGMTGGVMSSDVDVTDIQIAGNKATAKIAFGSTPGIDVRLLKEDGSWKVCPTSR